MLYFAYGSNMDWSQMRERCPTAQFVCVAKLKDHHLAFTRESQKRKCGVADVIQEEGRDVWGVVYQIDERDIGHLDLTEGFRPGRTENDYVREERHVFAEGDNKRPVLVSVYFAIKEDNPPKPNVQYKQLIVNGAKYWHLPDAYIQELERIEVMP
jgi:gamma-glutamylcyclotransferase